MRDLPNIEKSAFRKGEYVGYAKSTVWHIRRTNSSYGNWIAIDRADPACRIYAFRLDEMSRKLSGLDCAA